MMKAIITGFVTGVVISAILVGATYARGFFPDTFAANLFFIALFFSSITAVIWLSLNYYCKTSAVKWMSLSLTGIISSVIAALLVTIFQAQAHVDLYAPAALYTAALKTSSDFYTSSFTSTSIYSFRDLVTILFLITLSIVAIFYVRNRNRLPAQKDQELIF